MDADGRANKPKHYLFRQPIPNALRGHREQREQRCMMDQAPTSTQCDHCAQRCLQSTLRHTCVRTAVWHPDPDFSGCRVQEPLAG